MNIHEHQAKEILKKFDIKVPNGIAVFSLEEIDEKVKEIKTKKIAIKAQIHAGGRGKAGGIKIVDNINELKKEAKNLFGKNLVTHQTGPKGRVVKRLYLEETCDIQKEFYLSCLIDRSSSKIAFISSSEGGVNIEDVAKNNPEKIITTKLNLTTLVSANDIKKIIKTFNLSKNLYEQLNNLIQAIYKTLVEKDANLIEINPLILTKDKKLICLDAKINFDANALYRHPEILSLKDLNEEDPIETEASKYGLSYIKLNGKIGCMVNGAGLAMATMDIIKLYGSEPANFLDVGGGASAKTVSKAFKILLSDKNVRVVLVNIFGGIMRCDVIAEGIVSAVKDVGIKIPIVVRLEGTNVEIGKKILRESKLNITSADSLSDAAKQAVFFSKA